VATQPHHIGGSTSGRTCPTSGCLHRLAHSSGVGASSPARKHSPGVGASSLAQDHSSGVGATFLAWEHSSGFGSAAKSITKKGYTTNKHNHIYKKKQQSKRVM
jgi:hypothetical protein